MNKQKYAGFTLLEVMIAVVIMGIGLLGLASMQATSLKLSQAAKFRTLATNFSYGIIDAMRANRTAAMNGAYNTGLETAAPSGSTVANIDVAAWKTSLANTFPSGKGAITVNNTGGVNITIQWDTSREKTVTNSTEAATQSFTTESRL